MALAYYKHDIHVAVISTKRCSNPATVFAISRYIIGSLNLGGYRTNYFKRFISYILIIYIFYFTMMRLFLSYDILFLDDDDCSYADRCHPAAECIDLFGGWTCKCPFYMSGDGFDYCGW